MQAQVTYSQRQLVGLFTPVAVYIVMFSCRLFAHEPFHQAKILHTHLDCATVYYNIVLSVRQTFAHNL